MSSEPVKRDYRIHNMMLDMEIDQANRYNKMIEDENKFRLKKWESFLEANPEYPFKSCPYLIMDAPKIVCGIRYVE